MLNRVVKSFKIMSINITQVSDIILSCTMQLIDIFVYKINKRSVKYRPLGGYEILKFARINLLSQRAVNRAVASSRS